MKHTYSIESYCNNSWLRIIKDNPSLNYCRGFFDALRDTTTGPRNAYRLIRSDNKILDEIESNPNVSLGQIAGFPSAEQYETAANYALERAKLIRKSNNPNEICKDISIPNGIYDNTSTYRRERYHEGEVISFLSAEHLLIKDIDYYPCDKEWKVPWGTYNNPIKKETIKTNRLHPPVFPPNTYHKEFGWDHIKDRIKKKLF